MAKKKPKNVKMALGVAIGDNGQFDYSDTITNPRKVDMQGLARLSDYPNESDFTGCTVIDIHIFEMEVAPPKATPIKNKKLKAKKVVRVERSAEDHTPDNVENTD